MSKISLTTWDKLVEAFRQEHATYNDRINVTNDPAEIDAIYDDFDDAATDIAYYVLAHRAVIRAALALWAAQRNGVTETWTNGSSIEGVEYPVPLLLANDKTRTQP